MTDTTTQYPQAINFQLSQDKCGLLDSYTVGEEMKVSFNLRGREWFNPNKNITQYFNSLEAWRLEKVAAGSQAAAPQQSSTDNIFRTVNHLQFQHQALHLHFEQVQLV